MADVFLSYSRKDLRRARPVINALEAAGLSVWWDRRLIGGSEFSKEIRDELDKAAAVVALWSSRSVESPWVLDEAGRGRDSGRLVPASLASFTRSTFRTGTLARWTASSKQSPQRPGAGAPSLCTPSAAGNRCCAAHMSADLRCS